MQESLHKLEAGRRGGRRLLELNLISGDLLERICLKPIVWLLLLFVIFLPGTEMAAGEMIPALEAKNLRGEVMRLPADMAFEPAVLVLSFTRKGGDAAVAWDRQLASQLPAGTRLYSLLMLGGVPGWLRGALLSGIRSGLPVEARSRFVAVFERNEEWRRISGYRGGDDAWVLYLSPGGELLSVSHGQGRAEEIAAFLQQIKGR